MIRVIAFVPGWVAVRRTALALVVASAVAVLVRLAVVEAGTEEHMGLAGRHPLVQYHSFLLKCFNKVWISRIKSAGFCVKFITPATGIRVDPTFGRVEFSLQVLLFLFQSLDFFKPPVTVQPGHEFFIVV